MMPAASTIGSPAVVSSRRLATIVGSCAAAVLTWGTAGGCATEDLCGDAVGRPDDWTVASHCPGVAADYGKVFDDTVVHRFDIVISAADREATIDDLDEKLSGGGTSADLDALPNPMWIEATVAYDGLTWTHVGMRYKGHSSLKAAFQGGMRKLSFILDFEEYEDSYDELANQRFFGFQRLTFSNAYNDPSRIREKVAGGVFRGAGVPAARSAFAAAYLDWGEDPVYLGLYTLVEEPCDQMIATQIGGDGSGNLYKPWGEAARWLGTDVIGAEEIATHFDACTDDTTDRSDVIAAIDALNADRSDAASWRANLEAVFNVESFLRTLAVNQVMMNWDSYGCMHHNYFVYANPLDGGRITWFPWDLNESMLFREQTGCPEPGSVMLDELVLAGVDEAAIDVDWPLIRYLLNDTEYHQRYRDELRAAVDGPFAADPLIAQIEAYYELVAPYVIGPAATETWPYRTTTLEEFEVALTTGANALEPHLAARHEAVEAALATE